MESEEPGVLISKYIRDSVEMPADWLPGEAIDSHNFHNEYPFQRTTSGAVVLYEWGHDTREDAISLALMRNENSPFSVSVQRADGQYYGHGAQTLDEAAGACTAIAYMLNRLNGELETEKDIQQLESKVKQLNHQLESQRQQIEELESKRDLMMSQLETMFETIGRGYENGDWHGMNTRPQTWRPPTHDEIKRVANHIDEYWEKGKKIESGVTSEGAREVIENSFMIVLEDYIPVVDDAEHKLLFFQGPTYGLYGIFHFRLDDDNAVIVEQRSEMIPEDGVGDDVVRWSSHN